MFGMNWPKYLARSRQLWIMQWPEVGRRRDWILGRERGLKRIRGSPVGQWWIVKKMRVAEWSFSVSVHIWKQLFLYYNTVYIFCWAWKVPAHQIWSAWKWHYWTGLVDNYAKDLSMSRQLSQPLVGPGGGNGGSGGGGGGGWKKRRSVVPSPCVYERRRWKSFFHLTVLRVRGLMEHRDSPI